MMSSHEVLVDEPAPIDGRSPAGPSPDVPGPDPAGLAIIDQATPPDLPNEALPQPVDENDVPVREG